SHARPVRTLPERSRVYSVLVGGISMPDAAAVQALKPALRGQVIQPADAEYDAARKVYNGMIDRKPRLIARCTDVADVISAVNFARDHKLLVFVRGVGNNATATGVCDDGLVI